jgi:hypothetical protein
MWQTENDLRARIQELNSGAENPCGRLIDTITETDGSGESTKLLLNRLIHGVRRAVQGIIGRSQATISEPASMGRAK